MKSQKCVEVNELLPLAPAARVRASEVDEYCLLRGRPRELLLEV